MQIRVQHTNFQLHTREAYNSTELEVSPFLILDILVLANKEDMDYRVQRTCMVQRMLKAKCCVV